MKIKCTVCNKEFYYGDHNSPMFIDEVWNKIINYFKLTNFEKDAVRIKPNHSMAIFGNIFQSLFNL